MSRARQPEEISLGSWAEFEPTLQKIREAAQTEPGYPGFKTTLYRGHANSAWKLQTTLDRAYPNERSLLKYYWKASCALPALETLSTKRWDKLPTFPELKERLANQ